MALFFCCALRSSVPKPNHIAAQMLNAAMCEIRAWDNITVFCLCCLSIRSHWVQPPMALWVHSQDREHDTLVYASTLCYDILLFPAQRVHCCYCCWDLAVFLFSVCFFVSLSLSLFPSFMQLLSWIQWCAADTGDWSRWNSLLMFIPVH